MAALAGRGTSTPRRTRELGGDRHTTDVRRGRNSGEEKHERWSELGVDGWVKDKEKQFDIIPCKPGTARHIMSCATYLGKVSKEESSLTRTILSRYRQSSPKYSSLFSALFLFMDIPPRG